MRWDEPGPDQAPLSTGAMTSASELSEAAREQKEEGRVPDEKKEVPFPFKDDDPDVVERRTNNTPITESGLSREEAVEKLATLGPENPEATPILNVQIGLIQGKFEDKTYDPAAFNKVLVAFYMERTERNPAWRRSLADALFEAAQAAIGVKDEETARMYANLLTDDEYDERNH
ncbi:MAG: hypothetical protein WC640_00330 [Candidatus Paceibacterota bacterium]|jgi:hypothetical protein